MQGLHCSSDDGALRPRGRVLERLHLLEDVRQQLPRARLARSARATTPRPTCRSSSPARCRPWRRSLQFAARSALGRVGRPRPAAAQHAVVAHAAGRRRHGRHRPARRRRRQRRRRARLSGVRRLSRLSRARRGGASEQRARANRGGANPRARGTRGDARVTVRPLADPRCNAAHDPATALAIRRKRARSAAVGPRSRELTRGTGMRRATRRRATRDARRGDARDTWRSEPRSRRRKW